MNNFTSESLESTVTDCSVVGEPLSLSRDAAPRNRGDCDSKATLYLALLKAAHPDLESGFVYIKGHAYVGLGLTPKKGDMVFEANGAKWVIAEPVGPALMPVGQAGKKSEKKAKKGKIEFRRSKRPEGL